MTEREIALCDWIDEQDRRVEEIEDRAERVRERAKVLAEFLERAAGLWGYPAARWPAWARGIVDAANRWWWIARGDVSDKKIDRLGFWLDKVRSSMKAGGLL